MSKTSTSAVTRGYLKDLPKAELHLHLEGAVTPETLRRLSEIHDANPLTLEAIQTLYKYTDFAHFLIAFGVVCTYLRTPNDYAIVVYDMIRNLKAQGVRYAEVYMAWGNLFTMKPELWADIEGFMIEVERVRMKAEEEFGVKVNWVVDITRHRGPEPAMKIVEKAIELKNKGLDHIVGIGIGGDEINGPCRLFNEVYRVAREGGLRCVAHAGECTGPVDGPKEIWDALDIGCERIGHGVAAQWDPMLMARLRETQAAIEVCVTSNLCTGVVTDIEQHPITKYLEHGLTVVLNSDDPAMFGSDLLSEYELVANTLGLNKQAMKQLARNSFTASFLTEEEKKIYLTAIDVYGDGDDGEELV